jgi:methylenetetrahydrofolate reductase (NADPH)
VTFREKLFAGKFTVTGEITPHKGIQSERILSTLAHLRGAVDAVNVTDNQRSCVKASSLAVSKIVLDEGVEPVYQLTCRDRNRIGLQSDLLGAHMLGIRNVLALTGDHPSIGDHPGAKPVYDLDSTQLIAAVSGLNGGADLAGNRLDEKCDFLIGAALNPGADALDAEIMRAGRKIDAGADFFQTQVVYDVDSFGQFMKEMPKTRVLAGIVPLKSKRMAEFMNDKMPGVSIPAEIIAEIGGSENPVETGIRQAAEIIKGVKPHCCGVHIMALGSEQHVKTILAQAGL